MNKRIFYIGVLVVALALVATGCRLPASGSPPTVAPTTPPAATATSGLQLRSTNTSAPPATAVNTATLPPPTAIPTTAVPPTPVPPTPAPLPDAARIQFVAGGTSAVVNGELEAGQTIYYKLGASAKQTMSLKVTSPNQDVFLGLFDANQIYLAPASQDTIWSGILPATQDYYIGLTATGAKTTYSLTVDIPPLPGAPTPAAGPFDPLDEYGEPTFSDDMKGGNIDDWTNPSTGLLPDNSFIRITMENQEFLVTGKQAAFSTWYFTWHELDDFYLQATFETRDCTGKDAYGLIVRGPEHLAGEAYGYVVAFSCDGYLWVYRLDSANPYTTKELVSWTRSEHITAGADKVNVMGIKAIGDKLTIYANGHQIAEVTDDNYGFGRYGIFVSPELTANYTYRVVQMSYWDLTD